MKTFTYKPKGVGHGRSADPSVASERARARAAVYTVIVNDGHQDRSVYDGGDFNEMARCLEAEGLSKSQVDELLKAGTLTVA